MRAIDAIIVVTKYCELRTSLRSDRQCYFTEEMNKIGAEICYKTIQNFKKRVEICLEQEGGHFADLLK